VILFPFGTAIRSDKRRYLFLPLFIFCERPGEKIACDYSSSVTQIEIIQVKIMGQKRGHDAKGPYTHANKRKKAVNATNKNDSWDGFVGLEDLNWKEVPLPDRIEDAGGFFGLEEIEGVDIVRPNDNGEVRFKVRPSSSS